MSLARQEGAEQYSDGRERLAVYIRSEASKCMYCGFCEAVCPTLPLGSHRGYGPRGRVNIALGIANGSYDFTVESIRSIYTCLLCEACHLKCPASINIVGVVRATRALYSYRVR